MWELTSTQDTFDRYLVAVGCNDEQRRVAHAKLQNTRTDIGRSGKTWNIKVITENGEKNDSYPEGQVVNTKTLDGRDIKVVYTLEGDELVEVQRGDGFVSRNVRKVDTDTLTFTLNCNDVSCTRTYKKISK